MATVHSKMVDLLLLLHNLLPCCYDIELCIILIMRAQEFFFFFFGGGGGGYRDIGQTLIGIWDNL